MPQFQSKVLDYPQRTLRGNSLNLILQHLTSRQLKSSGLDCRFFGVFFPFYSQRRQEKPQSLWSKVKPCD